VVYVLPIVLICRSQLLLTKQYSNLAMTSIKSVYLKRFSVTAII